MRILFALNYINNIVKPIKWKIKDPQSQIYCKV
jgi:hypothetical protein